MRGQVSHVVASPGTMSHGISSCEKQLHQHCGDGTGKGGTAPQCSSVYSGQWQTAFKSFISMLGPSHEEQGKNVKLKHLKSNPTGFFIFPISKDQIKCPHLFTFFYMKKWERSFHSNTWWLKRMQAGTYTCMILQEKVTRVRITEVFQLICQQLFTKSPNCPKYYLL